MLNDREPTRKRRDTFGWQNGIEEQLSNKTLSQVILRWLHYCLQLFFSDEIIASVVFTFKEVIIGRSPLAPKQRIKSNKCLNPLQDVSYKALEILLGYSTQPFDMFLQITKPFLGQMKHFRIRWISIETDVCL